MATVSASSVTRSPRWARFIGIGSLGFLLQLATLWLLTSRAHWRWLAATLVAVELAVVHNFLWHERWTWRDRRGDYRVRFVRFQLANGVASMVGNSALMALFAGALGWPPIGANTCAVAVMAAVNFLTADRWVFRRSGDLSASAVACAACLLIPTSVAAQTAETVAGWESCVAATEARLERSRTIPRAAGATAVPNGESIRVPSGTVSDWRGSVFIPGITLDGLLHRLQHPGTPPPQDDIISSHVLARADDSLRVSIRLVRRAIVTVAYDTEHEMRFRRWTARLATARSVATRIEEVGGSDHGFLWRLHSYWRYEEVNGGVHVELESLTLSRDVPAIVRPIAAPLISQIARESMARTLEALRRYLSTTENGNAAPILSARS